MDNTTTIDFKINEDIRSSAIEEYIDKKSFSQTESQKRTFKKAYLFIIIIMCIIALTVVILVTSIGDNTFAIAFASVFALSFTMIAVIMSIILVKFSSTNNVKNLKNSLRKDIERTTYRIADGYLIREYEGDKRKTKKYDLNKIYYPDKEGDIGTFEYKNETIEYIDFYEPSLYETLKEIKAESQK